MVYTICIYNTPRYYRGEQLKGRQTTHQGRKDKYTGRKEGETKSKAKE
jgi:hypothetical protein